MQGIENKPQARIPQHAQNENSRRPGTSGHPGKHLGQFKGEAKADPANASLFEQQIKSLKAEPKNNPSVTTQDETNPTILTGTDTETTAEKVARNGQAQRGNSDATDQKADDKTFDIQLNHLQDTGDAFAEQIAFTSRVHAISTGFF